MKPENTLNHTEIKNIFNLLKMVDGTDSVKITDIAKEGGWKKTELMQYILDNKDLFGTEMSYNNKHDPAGRIITAIYDNAVDNPDTKEWLEMMKKKYEHSIIIYQSVEMGDFYGWYIKYSLIIDEKGKESQYRNTKEKFDKIYELLKKEIGSTIFYREDGSAGNWWTKEKYIIEFLKKNGWEVIIHK